MKDMLLERSLISRGKIIIITSGLTRWPLARLIVQKRQFPILQITHVMTVIFAHYKKEVPGEENSNRR